MDELERLEVELSNIEARLADAAHAARTPGRVLDDERQYRNELRARVEALKHERATQAPPPPQGGLSSPAAGQWAPLTLHEGPTRDETQELPPPPLEVEERPAEPDRAAISRTFARAVREGRGIEPITTVLRRWPGDVQLLRLGAAGLRTLHYRKVAQKFGGPPPALRIRDPELLTDVPWLDRATELPNEDDGLTTTQRQVLRALRTAAPPRGPFVRLSELARELAEELPALQLPGLEHVLLSLGNPSLRPFPLVELQGLSGRFSTTPRFTHARLSAVGLEVLEETFPLPMLLLNGAEGAGTTLLPFLPVQVLTALVTALEGGRDVHLEACLVEARVPDGARVSGVRGLVAAGVCELTLSARVGVEVDGEVGARLVVTQFPWPVTPATVLPTLHELQAQGLLDGVTAFADESSATGTRLVLTLEHVAFLGPVREVLQACSLFSRKVKAAPVIDVAGAPRRVGLADLLRAFIEHRKEVAVKRLDAALAHAELVARRAEAVVVALALLEPVQQALRDTLDDGEAVASLRHFALRPEHRARLASLPHPLSHPYDPGFTEDQARHLVGVRRLAHRRPDAALQEWTAALGARDAARARLQSRAAMLELVWQELVAARARFSDVQG